MIGPNFNLFGFELFYFVFYSGVSFTFLVLLIFGKQRIYMPLIYLVPFLCVFFSLIFKIVLGFEFAFVDFLYLVRYFNLILAFTLVFLIAQKLNKEQLEKIYRKYVKYIIFSLAFISIVGVLQYMNSSIINNPIFRLMYEYTTTDEFGVFNNFDHAKSLNRISSIYTGAIQFGSYLVFLSLIIMSHNFYKKNKALFYLIIISLLLIFLANSRASIAAAAITFFIMLYYKKRKHVFVIFFSIISFYIIISIGFNISGVFEKNEKFQRVFEVFDMFDKGKIEDMEENGSKK